MVITPYEASMAAEWDEFAARSRQQTFLLTRPYMDYHSDRFADASIIARSDSGRIVAMLPANRSGNILWSHQGLTYGGWITPVRGFDASSMLEVWALAIEYYRNNGVEEMLYKPLPWIYPSVPADDDLYALFRLGATMEACGVSSAVDLRDAPRFDENSRRNLRRAEVAGLRVGENRRFAEYWKILEDVLAGRHDTRPVHSLAEIELLASRFPENIRLFAVDAPMGAWLPEPYCISPRPWLTRNISPHRTKAAPTARLRCCFMSFAPTLPPGSTARCATSTSASPPSAAAVFSTRDFTARSRVSAVAPSPIRSIASPSAEPAEIFLKIFGN